MYIFKWENSLKIVAEKTVELIYELLFMTIWP